MTESKLTQAERAVAEALGFRIESRAGVCVVVYEDGARSATLTEAASWNVLIRQQERIQELEAGLVNAMAPLEVLLINMQQSNLFKSMLTEALQREIENAVLDGRNIISNKQALDRMAEGER